MELLRAFGGARRRISTVVTLTSLMGRRWQNACVRIVAGGRRTLRAG